MRDDKPMAPWEYADEPPGSLRWKMGPGEDVVGAWMEWVLKLPRDARDAYVEGQRVPEVWKEVLKDYLEMQREFETPKP